MRARLTVFVVGVALVIGCSVLVPIDDKPNPTCIDCASDDGPTGPHDGAGGGGGDGHVIVDDSPADDVEFRDVTPPLDAPDEQPSVCQGMNDGFNWKTDDPTARCCGGQAVNTVTNENCGVCGLKCTAPTACAMRMTGSGPHYYCVGCNGDNAVCWSQCCSATYDSCTASLCTSAACSMKCDAMFKNSHCETTDGGSDYCTY